MSHLRPSEIIDAAEGVLGSARTAHARDCARCRDEIARAAAALSDARGAGLPSGEPSPLFWDHLSARVRTAMESQPPRRPRAWRLWAPAAAAAALALVAAIATTREGAKPNPPPAAPAVSVPSSTVADAALPGAVDVDEDQWAFVADTAAELAWDEVEAAGFVASPGAADAAVLQLSDDQRQELAQLLEDEIGRLRQQS
jgi:hypothetical protein